MHLYEKIETDTFDTFQFRAAERPATNAYPSQGAHLRSKSSNFKDPFLPRDNFIYTNSSPGHCFSRLARGEIQFSRPHRFDWLCLFTEWRTDRQISIARHRGTSLYFVFVTFVFDVLVIFNSGGLGNSIFLKWNNIRELFFIESSISQFNNNIFDPEVSNIIYIILN